MKPADWYAIQKHLVETVPIPKGYAHVKDGKIEKNDLAAGWDTKAFALVYAEGASVEDYYFVIRPVKQLTKSYVTTVSGMKVSLLNPERRQIRIDDIAHHLAWTCRYNGHMKRWYSNAEHCLNCCWMAYGNVSLQRKLLVHDAGESITGDLSSPVKDMFPDYKKFAHEFQDFIYMILCGDKIEPPELTIIDQRMTATEMKYLRIQTDEDIVAEPYDISKEMFEFHCMERDQAKVKWLERFYQLFPEYSDVV